LTEINRAEPDGSHSDSTTKRFDEKTTRNPSSQQGVERLATDERTQRRRTALGDYDRTNEATTNDDRVDLKF